MRLIPRLGSRKTDMQPRLRPATAGLRLQALEDRSLPSFGFGSAFDMGNGGSGSCDGLSAAVDASRNLYVSGQYFGTVDFDPNHTGPNSVLTAAGATDGDTFVAKYAADGTFQWVTDLGSYLTTGGRVAVGGSAVYVSTFGAGGVARLDPANGAVLWNTTVGAITEGLAVDPSGNVDVTGKIVSGPAKQAFVTQLRQCGQHSLDHDDQRRQRESERGNRAGRGWLGQCLRDRWLCRVRHIRLEDAHQLEHDHLRRLRLEAKRRRRFRMGREHGQHQR